MDYSACSSPVSLFHSSSLIKDEGDTSSVRVRFRVRFRVRVRFRGRVRFRVRVRFKVMVRVKVRVSV